MARPSFLRHSGWVGPADLEKVTIIGCGAVGSNLALAAARMGFKEIEIWDADYVEDHNLPNQAFDSRHIGQAKTDALESLLLEFNPELRITKHNEFLKPEHKDQLSGPLVIAVDTMSARFDFYEMFRLNPEIDMVYDTRLGFDFGEIRIVDNLDPEACNSWYNTLWKDEEVEESPCSLRIITTFVNIVVGTATHLIAARYSVDNEKPLPSVTMISLSPELKVFYPKKKENTDA